MKKDGRAANNGQPKKQDMSKKKHIAIYETVGDVEELGGMDAVRALLKKAFEEAIKTKKQNSTNRQPANTMSIRPGQQLMS